MSLRNMEQIQNVINSSTLRDDARLMQPPPGAGPMPPGAGGPTPPPMGAGGPTPMPPGVGGPTPPPTVAGGPVPTLHAILTEPNADGESIQDKITVARAKEAGINTPKGLPSGPLINNLPFGTFAETGGGLMNLMMRDLFSGQVPGQGHGMEDNVYMPIVQRQEGNQVGTLAVSPDEYVVDAHTMSALGNGSADAGANVMDQVVRGVREKAYGTTQQPNEINGLAALRPMLERV